MLKTGTYKTFGIAWSIAACKLPRRSARPQESRLYVRLIFFLRRTGRWLIGSIAHPAWKAISEIPEHDPFWSGTQQHSTWSTTVIVRCRRVIPSTWLRLRCLIVVVSLIRWKLRWLAGMLIVLDHSGSSHWARKDRLRGIGIYGNRTVRMKASGMDGAVDLWSGNRIRFAHAAEATKPIKLS